MTEVIGEIMGGEAVLLLGRHLDSMGRVNREDRGRIELQ